MITDYEEQARGNLYAEDWKEFAGDTAQLLRELKDLRVAMSWRPIETAPKNGDAILGYGRHTHSPADVQHGVKPGDHWWAIMLWDVWRTPPAGERWVFAKDGRSTWSEPTRWMPLPIPPEADHA
jgi:hypothetical protein